MFMSERGAPMSPVGFRRMLERLGKAAKMAFGVHPHMLRHACGFKLANRTIEPCYRYLRALAREGHMNMARRKLLAALGGAVA